MSASAQPNQLHFDRQPVKIFADLVFRYGAKEFKSPMRSTIPLLSMVRDGWPQFLELLKACHLPADSYLHFEYRVDSPTGVGIPSHTDVMVRSGEDQLALECKWTEPRYETVGEWIVKPPEARKDGTTPDPDNRRKRLTGWLSILQPHATRSLNVEAFSDAVYQMVHRAASACMACNRPQLAYVIFTPLPDGKPVHTSQYEADLKHLRQILGNPTNFPFHLIEIPIEPTEAFRDIQHLAKGSMQTSAIVQDVLHKKQLFTFAKIIDKTIQ